MLSQIDIFALIAIMLVGLPHGAFDGAIAFFLGAGRTPARITSFLVAYSVLAGLYIGFWYIMPLPALIIFLALSIIHFGSGDIQPAHLPLDESWRSLFKAAQVFSHGGVVGIVIPSLHSEEVSALYTILTGGDASIIMSITAIMLPLWALSFVVYLLASLKFESLYGGVIEIGVLCILSAFLPPLAGFAAYFCLVHSRRHFLVIWHAMQEMLSRQTILITAFILTVVTWAIAAVAFYLQADLSAVSTGDAALRTVFISLAALTVPHMILVDTIFRPTYEKKRQA